MANYKLQCEDPKSVETKGFQLQFAISELTEDIGKFNTQLSEHDNCVGAANQELMDGLKAVGSKAVVDGLKAFDMMVYNDLICAAFDAHIALYGTPSDRDTRATV